MVDSSPYRTFASKGPSSAAPELTCNFPLLSTTPSPVSPPSTTHRPTTTEYQAKDFSSPPWFLHSKAKIGNKTTVIHIRRGIPIRSH